MYMYVCRCLPLANHLPPEDPAWCHDKTPTSSTQCCQDDFCNTRENYNGVIPGESCLKTIQKPQKKYNDPTFHIHPLAIPRSNIPTLQLPSAIPIHSFIHHKKTSADSKKNVILFFSLHVTPLLSFKATPMS